MKQVSGKILFNRKLPQIIKLLNAGLTHKDIYISLEKELNNLSENYFLKLLKQYIKDNKEKNENLLNINLQNIRALINQLEHLNLELSTEQNNLNLTHKNINQDFKNNIIQLQNNIKNLYQQNIDLTKNLNRLDLNLILVSFLAVIMFFSGLTFGLYLQKVFYLL